MHSLELTNEADPILEKTGHRFACLKSPMEYIVRMFRILAVLFNTSLSLYLIYSNTKAYIEYGERYDYVMTSTVTERNGSNRTSFFIHRSGVQTKNCTDDAKFEFDPVSVYKNIIDKNSKRNLLFVCIYWISTAAAILVNLEDIVQSIKRLDESKKSDSTGCSLKSPHYCWLCMFMKRQFIKKSAFLVPTYFIKLFDFSQVCLVHHTKIVLFQLEYVGITIGVGIFCVLCLIFKFHKNGFHAAAELLAEPNLTKKRKVHAFVMRSMSIALIPAMVFGAFIWATSMMEITLKLQATFIAFNFLLATAVDSIQNVLDSS